MLNELYELNDEKQPTDIVSLLAVFSLIMLLLFLLGLLVPEKPRTYTTSTPTPQQPIEVFVP